MRWTAILPILFLAGLLFLLYRQSGPDLVVEEQAKQAVKELWDRPLPWYPHVDSVTTCCKTSPDGVKMPTGWDAL